MLRTTVEMLGEALLTVFCVGKNIPRPRSRVRTGRVKCGRCGCAGTRGHGAEIAETRQQPRPGWWCGAGRNTTLQIWGRQTDRQGTGRGGRSGTLCAITKAFRKKKRRNGEKNARCRVHARTSPECQILPNCAGGGEGVRRLKA